MSLYDPSRYDSCRIWLSPPISCTIPAVLFERAGGAPGAVARTGTAVAGLVEPARTGTALATATALVGLLEAAAATGSATGFGVGEVASSAAVGFAVARAVAFAVATAVAGFAVGGNNNAIFFFRFFDFLHFFSPFYSRVLIKTRLVYDLGVQNPPQNAAQESSGIWTGLQVPSQPQCLRH